MISWLNGVVLDKSPPVVVLDVNGVGYEIQTSMSTFFDLPESSQAASLFIHNVIREDANLLFGFSTKRERQLFQTLIKVNGIGPKLALGILSSSSPNEFVQLIFANDLTRLVKLPGVGKKTAERLLVELNDKLANWDGGGQAGPVDCASNPPMRSSHEFSEAIEALVSLGFKPTQAEAMVKPFKDSQLNTEAMIRQALKHA